MCKLQYPPCHRISSIENIFDYNDRHNYLSKLRIKLIYCLLTAMMIHSENTWVTYRAMMSSQRLELITLFALSSPEFKLFAYILFILWITKFLCCVVSRIQLNIFLIIICYNILSFYKNNEFELWDALFLRD